MHCLRQHQEGTRHQEQEEVEVEQGLEEQEVREDAGAEAPAHSLQRQLPQLEGVQEGQPAVPTLSGTLGGESGRENHSNLIYNLIFEKINTDTEPPVLQKVTHNTGVRSGKNIQTCLSLRV